MEDLLQSQIKDNCRLALPEGLRDLMSDISREVLRAQPTNLYEFIVSYLEAMLLARGTLCIACQVCQDVCQCTCHPELEDELRDIGLRGEDLETVKNLVTEYFDKGNVNEENLLMKLFNKTDIDPNMLSDILDAVREAFQKHRQKMAGQYWEEAEKANEAGQAAAQHTLDLYDRLQEDKELSWETSVTKIQTAYRGHVVRIVQDEDVPKLRGKLAQIQSSNTILPHKDFEKPSTSRHGRNNVVRRSFSSTSLAGSLVNLPKYVPYSVHDLTLMDFDEHETERTNIDYTLEHNAPKDTIKEEGPRKIVFHEQHVLHHIPSCSDEEDIEEHIQEDIHSDATSVEENISNVGHVDKELESNVTQDIEKPLIKDFEDIMFPGKDSNTKTRVDGTALDKTESKDEIVENNNEYKIKNKSRDVNYRKSSYEKVIEETVEEEEYSRDNSAAVGSMGHIVVLEALNMTKIELSDTAVGKELQHIGSCSLSSD